MLLVAGVAATLTRAVPVLVGTNGVATDHVLGGSAGRVLLCQDAERVPAGTGAVRVSLDANGRAGPPVQAAVRAGDTLLARGALAGGWRGTAATIPLKPVTRRAATARVCVTIGAVASVALRGEPLQPEGEALSAIAAGEPLGGRVRFDYLAPRRRSLLGQAGIVAHRMGFAHATRSLSVALLAALATLAAAVLGLRLVVRGER